MGFRFRCLIRRAPGFRGSRVSGFRGMRVQGFRGLGFKLKGLRI